MPLALLLSPDDQAVSAITGVLEEMSVTCERPLDGVSAAQLLNSHAFDLVLVDCENLPAAKLIFDVCRRGKNGNNPVPIAIVDGRAGLPTAFRLGAELILTKPVAKDQARTTIRTAVGRVRKDIPAGAGVSAQAAAAAAGSSPAPEHASLPSNLVSTSAASAELNTTTASSHSAAAVKPAVKEDEIFAPVHSKPVIPLTPSDDPVLAELERTELEESESAKSQSGQEHKPSSRKIDSQNVESQNSDSKKDNLKRTQAHDDDSVVKSDAAPAFATLGARQSKRAPLVALMTLVIAGGGLYGAWMYEPGFRAIAQPQIDRVLALAGVATPAAHLPSSVKPSAPPVSTAAPAASSMPAPADSATAQLSAPSDSSTDAASAPPAAGQSTAAASTATTSTAVSVPSSPSSTAAAPAKDAGSAAIVASVNSKPANTKQDSAKDVAAISNLSPSVAPLPGESTAIILSSQGAQKRLVTGVPPKYPVEARPEGAEGTVVLKAVIDDAGKVAGLRLVEGNATLAPAAMQAVKRWRYRPYVRDGKSQPFQTIVIVDFQKP
jgi:periplasmic protein TonB